MPTWKASMSAGQLSISKLYCFCNGHSTVCIFLRHHSKKWHYATSVWRPLATLRHAAWSGCCNACTLLQRKAHRPGLGNSCHGVEIQERRCSPLLHSYRCFYTDLVLKQLPKSMFPWNSNPSPNHIFRQANSYPAILLVIKT